MAKNVAWGKKIGSWPISRVLSWTTIHLGSASPQTSSNLPAPDAGRANRCLFGLAPSGVYRAGLLPDSRCALTAPFHPYHAPCGRSAVCSLLHWPSAHAAQVLPGTLPYGARTFLHLLQGSDCLANSARKNNSSRRRWQSHFTAKLFF